MVNVYRFDAAFPPDHFVSDYIAYAASCTDASWEYHEAAGLILLSLTVPDVRVELGIQPGGLSTNLFVMLLGETSVSRKSTAKDHAQETYKKVDIKSVLPSSMSPEGFLDQLAQRSPGTSFWPIDELSTLLVSMQKRDHMKGLEGSLLEIYAGRDYSYSRSKKKGQPDDVVIAQPHLSILGCTTPRVFDKLHRDNLESGLLPRFAIIMPDTKPARIPVFKLNGHPTAVQNGLIVRLAKLRPGTGAPRRSISFTPEAQELLDERIKPLEASSTLMVARLPVMLIKVAMLSAIGRPWTLGTPHHSFEVTADDVRSAMTVIDRWEVSAVRFEQKLGESRVERHVKRVLDLFRRTNKKRPLAEQQQPMEVYRRDVARELHVTAMEMKEVEAVLFDRGVINIKDAPNRRKDSAVWIWEGQNGEANDSLISTDTNVTTDTTETTDTTVT
jgi:hypothetical protein